MFKSFSRPVALVLAGGAVALAGAALPAEAAGAGVPGWRISSIYPVRNGNAIFTSVDAVSARDAWAVGFSAARNSGTFQTPIRHWNGKAWAAVSLPPRIARAWSKTEPIEAQIGASSSRNVWVMAGLLNGSYLRLSGKQWSIGRLPGSSLAGGKAVVVRSVKAFSPSNVWALGATVNETNVQPTETPYAAHFNGHRWTVTHVPGDAGITGVGAASSASIWAVIGTSPLDVFGTPATGQQSVVHWTARSGWQQPVQPVLPAGSHLTGVLTEPGGRVLIGGSEPNADKGRSLMTMTWNGKTWSAPSLPGLSSVKWELADLAPDGRGGTWALGAPSNGGSVMLWHLTGTRWSAMKPGFGKHAWMLMQLAAVPHSDSVWGVGALQQGKAALGLIALAGPTPH